MRKRTAVFVAAFLFAALAAAQEPWKSRPYTEWTAEDVRRVLDDSPWARVVTVDVTWRKPGEKPAPPPTDLRMDTPR
ncbi:MAG TPA: hypothetical protein VNL38_00915, partial [Candidatus Nitrosotenuis sp.]|nr:hypothetical protein [Candidatus Nitrosotenuis sp.]